MHNQTNASAEPNSQINIETQPSNSKTKNPATPKTKNPNKPYFITLASFGVVILALVIANIAVALIPHKSKTNQVAQTQTEQVQETDAKSSQDLKPLEELSDDEVIEAFHELISADYTGPEGLIDPKIVEGHTMPYFVLEYSYDDPDEIIENDYHISNFGKFDLELSPIENYAMLVTANTEDAPREELISTLSNSLGIAFDKDYINYYEEEIKEDNYTSHEDRTVFTNTSEEFLEQGLPLFYVASEASSLTSIYDYDFEIDKNKALLTVYNIGLGLNMEALSKSSSSYAFDSDSMYALNLYIVQCTVDLDTGEFEWIESENQSRNDYIRSIPLSNEVVEALTEEAYTNGGIAY